MEKSIGFIGPGKMAGAIIDGLLENGHILPENIYIYGRGKERVAYFESKCCKTCQNIGEMTKNCQLIFLCVKPQNFSDIYKILKPEVSNKNVFVSVAAGITFENMKNNLGQDIQIIRAMPNTPMLIGKGVVSLSKTDNVSEDVYEKVKSIFSSCATVVDVEEDLINTVIATSGSSPAYIYYFAKIVADFAEEKGLSRETAKILFAKTLIGSAEMILTSELSEEGLMEQVSSKGGTTIEATKVLKEQGLEGIVKNAMNACIKRAEELTSN